MPGRMEEIFCFSAEHWSQECASGGQFNLVWCGKEDCKNDAARRRGHWVTGGNTGGISCFECSRPYQRDGQLNKALARTLNKGICADCKDAGVPEEAPEWYTAPEKPERKQAKTTAETAWNADGWPERKQAKTTAETAWNADDWGARGDEGKAESATWKRSSWGSNEPWDSKDHSSKPSNREQPSGLGEAQRKMSERIQALVEKTQRQEECLEELANRMETLEGKVLEQDERVQKLERRAKEKRAPEGGEEDAAADYQ